MKRWNLRYFALYAAPAAQLVLLSGECVEVHSCLFACATKLLQGRAMHKVTRYAHAQVGEPPANSLRLHGAAVKVSPCRTMHMVAALEAWRQTCSSCAALSALLVF